jgi:2-keto-4-pentenoate hydratase/2-oxohepta-3-ene-1,7-dioic acid hydratase in catechol pathway
MPVARYRWAGQTWLGLLDTGRLYPLPDVPPALVDSIGVAAVAGPGAARAADRVGVPAADVTILAPVPRPGKIVCVGANYAEHAAEHGMAVPDHPNIFAKFSSSVLDPGQPIVIPAADRAVDWEGELCVVIGRRGYRLAPQDALDIVAGWTAANDVSARTWQLRVSQWTLGKSFDTFCPIGPWMATVDEIPDPGHLALQTRVNAEVVQSSNTARMVHGVRDLISFISAAVTLEPGDLILTGTPEGVGHAMTPPRYLRAGDQVEVEIEGIGVLRNPVVRES